MSLKKKNIFITGISGFVGSHMARYLLSQGASISGLVRKRADGSTPLNIANLGIENDVELFDGDIRDISSVVSSVKQSKPDMIFHFAAQSFIPRSFDFPGETMEVNCLGTANLLEAIRTGALDPVVVFAGSNEEYGLVIFSCAQYKRLKRKYGVIVPEPIRIPELPINEANPLRPMSPYAVSKIYADYLTRNYHTSFGLSTIVSRGFSQEGAGRGKMYVTSTITHQVMQLKRGEVDRIVIGNVNAFRDWSHIDDIVRGYCLLAEKGTYGDVYNQGSQRTNSVLSYLLLSLECAGYHIDRITTIRGNKSVENPTKIDNSVMFGLRFAKTKIDKLMLEKGLEFRFSDSGIIADTDKGKVTIRFDKQKLRQADVPILLTDTTKIRKLGFKANHSLKDIINEQLDYFADPAH